MNTKNRFSIIAVSLSIIAFVLIVLKYNCPIKLLFGISCPFCGMTRALVYAIQFKFKLAFQFHFFWPFVLFFLTFHVLFEYKIIKFNKKVIYWLLFIFTILNLIYYFYRMFLGSYIVQCNFNESLIYKLVKVITSYLK